MKYSFVILLAAACLAIAFAEGDLLNDAKACGEQIVECAKQSYLDRKLDACIKDSGKCTREVLQEAIQQAIEKVKDSQFGGIISKIIERIGQRISDATSQ